MSVTRITKSSATDNIDEPGMTACLACFCAVFSGVKQSFVDALLQFEVDGNPRQAKVNTTQRLDDKRSPSFSMRQQIIFSV